MSFSLESGRGQPHSKTLARLPRAKWRSAFTLLELVVVLAIIGVLTAMIIPEMRGSYEDALLRSSARKLISVFELAYSRAVSLNQAHRVRLDRMSGRYLIEQRSRTAETLSGFVALNDVSGAEGTLDQRISFRLQQPGPELPEEGSPESSSTQEEELAMPALEEVIGFYPDGTADGLEILLRDRAGFRLTLRVNPITARVHILEGKGH